MWSSSFVGPGRGWINDTRPRPPVKRIPLSPHPRMAHVLANIHHAPCNDNAQTALPLEQILEVLFEVVPHMPIDSQISFISMFRGNTLVLPPHEAPKARPPTFSNALRRYLHSKTIHHLTESDLAFQEKQRAVARTSKGPRGSKGITKRYDKPQNKRAREGRTPSVVFPLMDPYTTPHGATWVKGSGAENNQTSDIPGDPLTWRPHPAPAYRSFNIVNVYTSPQAQGALSSFHTPTPKMM